MKINPIYKLHSVAGENIILLNNEKENKVVSLNPTSVYLWEQLQGKTFELQDIVRCLTQKYEVDEATASADADRWIKQLDSLGIIIL